MQVLTPEQRQAVQTQGGTPLQLQDPDTQVTYVLLELDAYQRLVDQVRMEQFDIEEAYPLMDEIAAKEGWDDPALDVYNEYLGGKKP